MPKASKTLYICQSCAYQSPRWSGRCPQCGEWNSLVETVVSTRSEKLKIKSSKLGAVATHASPLSKIKTKVSKRLTTSISEFNRTLGGGIVPGSVVLLAGEPGVGKSTLLLQVASSLPSKPSSSVLYISGEESPSQIKLRADRLGIKTDNIQILAETDVDAVLHTLSTPYTLVIVDSVQSLTTANLNASAGSISQVREATYQLAQKAKETGIPVILVGHVTKEGSIAGPKVLEHMVDVVLYLEGDKFHSFRLLRSHKNRFGSDQEVGVFAMGDKGLSEVRDPSNAFLAGRLGTVPGSVVTATMEGTRPVLVEIQALTTATSLAYPRRTASGFDYNRLNLLVAVLQKHLNLPLQNKDIYVNVASGFKIGEPAADLAVALSIVSSVEDQPVPPQVCAFGEVGLAGEVRRVPQIERRTKEAKKLGFSRIISPESVRSVGEAIKKLKVES